MKINYRFIGSFVIVVIALFLLGTGSEILVQPIVKGVAIPLGTFITWIGIIALPLTILYGSKSMSNPSSRIEKIFHKTLKALCLLGFSWGFVSYWLAANWSFNFSVREEFRGSPDAYEYFKIFTIILVLLPIGTGLVFAIRKLILSLTKVIKKEN